MKTLHIHRAKGFYGMIRTLKVLVDGNEVAALKQKQSKTIEVDSAAVELQGKMDWGRTEVVPLDNVQSGQTMTFTGHFSINPLKALGLTNLPFRVTIH